jgi:hypothetical protein
MLSKLKTFTSYSVDSIYMCVCVCVYVSSDAANAILRVCGMLIGLLSTFISKSKFIEYIYM